MKGTVETGEAPADAALRELQEESGIVTSEKPRDLGKSKGIEQGESWHFYLCKAPSLPDTWEFETKHDHGLTFRFFWHPLDEYINEGQWHPCFVRAIRFAQNKINGLSKAEQKQYFSQQNTSLATALLNHANALGVGKSFNPTEVAVALSGKDEKEWRKLMGPIRDEAIRLARSGELTIFRKGKPADPDNFKGVYKIGLPLK